jgi:hypothetical protein
MADETTTVGRERLPASGGTIEMLPYDALPLHDSTWGLCTGVTGDIFIAACGEGIGGLSVIILRYRPERDELEYLIEVGPAIGEPPDNGRATQSKIHYCLIPSETGLLYCSTHCSGPPIHHPIWRPWNTWCDANVQFPGAHIFTFDPETRTIDDFGIGPRREGSRALALDEKRGLLYGITYPRNHFYIYEIESRTYRDLGRFGDINPQAVWLDRDGNAYTTDDYGWILRCPPNGDDLASVGVQCPHEAYRVGWHNVAYDVVPSPDWSCFYGTDWGFESHLWRFDPYPPSGPRMDDLGRAFGPPDFRTDHTLEGHQVRGLVFGMDGKLYFTMRSGWEEEHITYLLRLNVETLEREVVCPLQFGDHRPVAIASATPDYYGNLYFAEAGCRPTRVYIYRPDEADGVTKRMSWKDIKPWG